MAESLEREKLGTHRRRKVDKKSYGTFLLCDPAGTSNEVDAQNKWEENRKHTHTDRTTDVLIMGNSLNGD